MHADTIEREGQAEDLAPAVQVDIHVGSRLRARRQELGISQGSLGQRLGLTFSQIQKYEKGSNRIGAGRLYQFAAILGVPVQYFFEDFGFSAHEQHFGSASTVAADAESMRGLVARIPDPDARQALLALASSMASD